MSDLEKFLEELDGLERSHENFRGVFYDIKGETLDQLIQFLGNLQPSDNGELVERLVKSVKTRHEPKAVFKHHIQCDISDINEAIAALEAPKPFDVVRHLTTGGAVVGGDGLLVKVGVFGDLEYSPNGGGYWKEFSDVSDYQSFCADIIEERLKLYEPEPSAEQLIEDARETVKNLYNGKVFDPKLIDKALDAFEKLTLKTGE